MRASVLFLLFLAAGISSAQHRSKAPSPVGTWRYDLASLKVTPNDQAKREMAKDPKKAEQYNKVVVQLIAGLKAQLKIMKLVFKPNKSFVVLVTKPQTQTLGTWSMTGSTIHVIMVDAKQPTPRMELSKDGKRIITNYSDARFGTARADLVRS